VSGAAPVQNKGLSTVRELLTDDERERLAEHGGLALLGWARRVRLEAAALEALLGGDPEPSSVLPFGRRSSAAWDG
jgi:hypothetical protein